MLSKYIIITCTIYKPKFAPLVPCSFGFLSRFSTISWKIKLTFGITSYHIQISIHGNVIYNASSSPITNKGLLATSRALILSQSRKLIHSINYINYEF
jgi:hypothetical protein